MGTKKSKIRNTDLNNLISNLRGEIGEVVSSWILLKFMMHQYSINQTNDISADVSNPTLTFWGNLIERLENDIVSRLSELSERKVGRLTFHFVAEKTGKFAMDVQDLEGLWRGTNSR